MQSGTAARRHPRVTVLMGVYNAGSFVAQAMQSILRQTFADLEFLIIDDGSTDETPRIVTELAGTDPRIRFIRNAQNRGLGAVLAQGVDLALGEYVARMDADDLSLPDRLDRQVNFLDSNPHIHIVGSYALDVDDSGAVSRERRVPITHERILQLIWSCPLIHPTVMFRRAAIVAAGSYSPGVRRRQDYELWFRCAKAGLGFANIPEPLLKYHYSLSTLRRNDLPSAWRQVVMGLAGCRMVGAAPSAYLATAAPLVEAILPAAVRARLHWLKKRVDPRNAG